MHTKALRSSAKPSDTNPVSTWKITTWDLFALIIPFIAISPLLYLQSMFLWEKEHLQFYPLAFAAAAFFLYTEGAPDGLVIGWRRHIAVACSVATMGLVALSLVIISPWMAQFALVLLIFNWALGRFGKLTPLRILGICGLIAVTVPAPGGWDHRLVQSLQQLSSTICSHLMDATNVLHIKRGNIIEIVSKPLFVEEACSGVDSQYALMTVAGVLLLVGRAGLIVSMITIVTVPIWAILGNLLRIYTIVLGLEFFSVDLSSGPVHTVLGLVVFLVAAWAHWSSVQFLNYLELMYYTDRSIKSKNPLAWAPGESVSTTLSKAIRKNEGTFLFAKAWLTFPILLLLLAPVGLAAVIEHYQKEVPSISRSVADSFPGERDLPSIVTGQSRLHFQHESRNIRNIQGQHSRTWHYLGEFGQQVVSLDLPFRGWHPLWECYENAGWSRESTVEIKQSPYGTTLDFTFYESVLENLEGDFAILHFSLFDELGRPYTTQGGFERLEGGNRFAYTFLNMFNRDKTRNEPLTFQIQMLSKTREPATEELKQRFREIYLTMRQQIYEKAMPVVSELKGK